MNNFVTISITAEGILERRPAGGSRVSVMYCEYMSGEIYIQSGFYPQVTLETMEAADSITLSKHKV